MLVGLDLYSIDTDLTLYLIAAAVGSTVDYLDDLDGDLSKV